MSGLARVYPPRYCGGCCTRSFATSHARRFAAIHAERAQLLNKCTNALVIFPIKNPNPNPHGPLSNLTVAVKDNICTTHLPTTCSSNMLRRMSTSMLYSRSNSIADFTSPFDATAVELLKATGANIIGKANCDEFGMGQVLPLGFPAFR